MPTKQKSLYQSKYVTEHMLHSFIISRDITLTKFCRQVLWYPVKVIVRVIIDIINDKFSKRSKND